MYIGFLNEWAPAVCAFDKRGRIEHFAPLTPHLAETKRPTCLMWVVLINLPNRLLFGFRMFGRVTGFLPKIVLVVSIALMRVSISAAYIYIFALRIQNKTEKVNTPHLIEQKKGEWDWWRVLHAIRRWNLHCVNICEKLRPLQARVYRHICHKSISSPW